MDGIHDLGGRNDFGPLEIEQDEPFFHHHWEKKVFSMAMAAPFVAEFGDDQFRRQIEHLSPQQYLESSYYELWFEGMVNQLKELNVVSDAELKQATSIHPLPTEFDINNQAQADGLMAIVEQGLSQAMPGARGAHRFGTDDKVVTLARIPATHTRLPQYARGKIGRVIAEHGMFIFADTNSVNVGLTPQMLYTVEFQASELWGDEAQPGDTLCLDLWDAYLEPPA